MNIGRHVSQHLTLFQDLAEGKDEEAHDIVSFYDEYFAVLDLHADYYLETVDRVFMRHLLAKSELTWRGEKVDPTAVTRTGLMTVEGERDDICGLGQTMAAHDLCSNVPTSRHRHHLQLGVGHYGVFSGRRWRQETYPMVRTFILQNELIERRVPTGQNSISSSLKISGSATAAAVHSFISGLPSTLRT